MVPNGDWRQLQGKCNRKYTAHAAFGGSEEKQVKGFGLMKALSSELRTPNFKARALAGKGEMVRQELTSPAATRELGKPHPMQGQTGDRARSAMRTARPLTRVGRKTPARTGPEE